MYLGKRVFAISLVFIISGCGPAYKIVQKNTTTTTPIDYPSTGVVVSSGLGERLVSKGIRVSGETLALSQDTVFGMKPGEGSALLCYPKVKKGMAFKNGSYNSEEIEASCFGNFYANYVGQDGDVNHWNCRHIPKDNVFSLCKTTNGRYFATDGYFPKFLEVDNSVISESESDITSENNFVQEFVYNGKVGNSLKFIYREFSDNLARPGFTQEVQYDANESEVIGFKSLRIQVIDATNTNIKYKLLKNFD